MKGFVPRTWDCATAAVPNSTRSTIDHWERKLIIEALKRTGDNVPEAAKLLNIGRATLYRKIEQYKIPR